MRLYCVLAPIFFLVLFFPLRRAGFYDVFYGTSKCVRYSNTGKIGETELSFDRNAFKQIGLWNRTVKSKYRHLTLAPLMFYGVPPFTHLPHTLECVLPALHFILDNPGKVDTLVFPEGTALTGPSNGFLRVTLGAFFRLHPVAFRIEERPINQEICFDRLAIITGFNGLHKFAPGFLGPFARSLFLEGCKEQIAVAPTTYTDLLLYRRHMGGPQQGNLRGIVNDMYLAEAVARMNHTYLAQSIPRTFCEQIGLLHKMFAKAIVSIHGAQLFNLIVLPRPSLVIEVHPRHMHSNMFCPIGRTANARWIHLAMNSVGGESSLRDWCADNAAREVNVPWTDDCQRDLQCANYTTPTTRPDQSQADVKGLVYLTENEIRLVADAIDKWIRGRGEEIGPFEKTQYYSRRL